MTALRWVLALILTVALLYIARTNSRGQPEHITQTENGFTFEMTTVPKVTEHTTDTIHIHISGPFEPGLRVVFRSSRMNQDASTPLVKYGSAPMLAADSARGLFYTVVSAGSRGGKFYYYFEIRDNTGGYRAGMFAEAGEPFVLKYIGEVPDGVLYSHIFFMFATVFAVVLGALYGAGFLLGQGTFKSLSNSFTLAALFAFIGGYPLGFMMNYYAFDVVWEGVPFGTDATDNKTQLLFVYLLFMALICRRSMARKVLGKDLYSRRAVARFGIMAFFLLLAIYLIPHSIQFTPDLTRAVCYSFIGLVVVLYGGAWAAAWRRKK